MMDFRKNAEEWKKLVNDKSDALVKVIDSTTKNVSDKVKVERKKLELKSQIGEHQRAVTKAYTRLGEAYYESTLTGKSMDEVKDVVELVRTNRKVIDLLNEQLATLTPKVEDLEKDPKVAEAVEIKIEEDKTEE